MQIEQFPPHEALDLYRQMLRIRRTEEQIGWLFSRGLTMGTAHLSIGQEASAFFGDGAANAGTFHEALNMAAVWRLPIVFVCENNGYAMWTSASRTTSVSDI